MENYNPPFDLTNKMVNYISSITEKISDAKDFIELSKYPELRRNTRIRSIHSSLAIEGNMLSLDQTQDVIDGKMVIGDKKDIQEVKNAYNVYDKIDDFDPYSVDDLKKAHEYMTVAILDDCGKFRNHGEAVYDGDVEIFMAPPHDMVPSLMDNLFNWMNAKKDELNPLILSSVFHYEFVFIHPFTDGNGRIARLWQTVILSHWKGCFKYMPIESIIKEHQAEYYEAIGHCNDNGKSNEFIEFMLKIIDEAIDEMNNSKELKDDSKFILSENELKIMECIKKNVVIGAKDIIEQTGMSDRTVRRILKKLADQKFIETIGVGDNDPNKRYKIVAE